MNAKSPNSPDSSEKPAAKPNWHWLQARILFDRKESSKQDFSNWLAEELSKLETDFAACITERSLEKSSSIDKRRNQR